MDTDRDTLATALYVRVDDALKQHSNLAPSRPEVGSQPKLPDAELITVAVMQSLLGFTSETRWLGHARRHLMGMFPYLPVQSGYNKRRCVAAPTTDLVGQPPSRRAPSRIASSTIARSASVVGSRGVIASWSASMRDGRS